MEDKRFAHVLSDPKFRRIPKSERKVKIDNRFQSMFKDKKFKVKYTIDKRGRPVNHSTTEDLKRYYELSSEEESSESDNEQENDQEESDSNVNELNIEENASGKFVKAPENDESDLFKSDKSDKINSEDVKKKLKNLNVDYARGERTLFSESSSDDEESDGEESESEEIDHKWGELDADAERTDEITHRLAACNMDWDRIRAVDLMVLFNSFIPPGGFIKSVVIYPSQFGLERMKEEESKGPIELVDSKLEVEADDEKEEGSKYHMEKLRQYQLNRLKYYYAVITCDCANTANKIYTECDGMEYESSATKIDLRFIPDDTEFDEEPKEACEKLPEVGKYQPRFFTTTALQQAKVDLTWDETDPDRIEITQKLASGKIDDIADTDLQHYLASSSGESEDDEENKKDDVSSEEDNNPIEKYKALLQDIEKQEEEKKNKDVEMEVMWDANIKEQTEKIIKKKLLETEDKTPFQKYLDKKKEKRKSKREQRKKTNDNSSSDDSDIPSDIDMNDPYFAEEFDTPEFKKKSKNKNKKNFEDESDKEDKQNKAELELLLLNEEEDGKKHFNLKNMLHNEHESKTKKKRKLKKKQEEADTKDDFELNVNDERFSALYTSHLFNIDPTDPHFKKTKGMEKIIDEKLKRKIDSDEIKEAPAKKPKAELNALVKSVKRKTAQALHKS